MYSYILYIFGCNIKNAYMMNDEGYSNDFTI